MNTFPDEKRKNEARRFPWRTILLLAIGFILGVILTLTFGPSRNQSIIYFSSGEGFELTATRIIQQATEMAGGVFSTPLPMQQPGQDDPLLMTATAIIQQATQAAGS